MNFENSKISEHQRLLLNLSGKTNLKSSDKQVDLSNLSTCYTWKNKKKSCNLKKCNNNLKS